MRFTIFGLCYKHTNNFSHMIDGNCSYCSYKTATEIIQCIALNRPGPSDAESNPSLNRTILS